MHQRTSRRLVFLLDIDARLGDNGKQHTLFSNLTKLLSHPVFVLACFGGALYIGHLHSLEYWGARALEAVFQTTTMDFIVGAILVVTSITGALLGGVLLDAVFGTSFRSMSLLTLPVFSSGASTRSALYLSSVALAISVVILVPIVLFMDSMTGILILLSFSLLNAFIPQVQALLLRDT